MLHRTRSLLFTVLICFCIGSFSFAEEGKGNKVALILDQPAQQAMMTQTGIMSEIAARVVGSIPGTTLTLLFPEQDGRFLDRQGRPADLNSFDILWLNQGDTATTETPFCSQAVIKRYQEWLALKDQRGIVLTGTAARLIKDLGYGIGELRPVVANQDDFQLGLIPIRPDSTLFRDIPTDRGVAWYTNATYCSFESFNSNHDHVVTLAREAGGRSLSLLAGWKESKEGKKVVRVSALAMSVNPLYYDSPQSARTAFENLLRNLLRQSGQELNPADITPLAFVLPDFTSLRLALNDLIETHGDQYIEGPKYLAALDAMEQKAKTVTDKSAAALTEEYRLLQKKALLANPDLNFDQIVYIKRKNNQTGFPTNYNGNSAIPATGYDNEIRVLDIRTGKTSPLFRPGKDEFVGDLELHFDANRLLFSMPDKTVGNRWRVWELGVQCDKNIVTAKESPKLIPQIPDADVDNYDACYLPDDRFVFCSTACFTGVPCINGSGHVCNLFQSGREQKARPLTVDQDHDWSPVVMNNGRVMYQRWEYTDLPHCFSRILFHMNPDGTNQSELYGSGSEWPNALFYARPVPNHPTKFVAIVSGHHELPRTGDLVLFDPALGRFENEGAIQRIPGRNKKVEPFALDCPIAHTWPKFVHPMPITDRHFLVSCKRTPSSGWALCLVDVYDNIVTLYDEPGFSSFEPVPLRKTPRPPVVPDRVSLDKKEADVFIADIYRGQGLPNVPRGTVKSLRIFSYQFAYQGMGAEPYSIGLDGPWDPKRVLGTVPVYEDGSAAFKIPAYTPIAIQPLDEQGKAIQIMRSWITAMPGESVSCIGCHEKQNETGPTIARTIAAQKKPVEITSFYGPVRGFSFDREIQPILDKYCLECHQPNSERVLKLFAEQKIDPKGKDVPFVPDFRNGPRVPLTKSTASINTCALFSPSYYQLRRFVRTPTKESQMAVLPPYECHADSTRLIQLLQQNHYGVQLDGASWDRLFAWIDLNAPYHGNWSDIRGINAVKAQWKRRQDIRKLYAGLDTPDDQPENKYATSMPGTPDPNDLRNRVYTLKIDPELTAVSDGYREPTVEKISLGNNVELELVAVPGTKYKIGRFEITNRQYRQFNPRHNSGIEFGDYIQFSRGEKGYTLNREEQPAVRVSALDADAFCKWLSKKTGKQFVLPTVSQWRWAATAQTSTPFWFGDRHTDYTAKENLGDLTFAKINDWGWPERADILPTWRPADLHRNDRSRVAATVGSYLPNPWSLFDMLGNVSEWTSSNAHASGLPDKRIVCGGSWATQVQFADRNATRILLPWSGSVDIGFRVLQVSP